MTVLKCHAWSELWSGAMGFRQQAVWLVSLTGLPGVHPRYNNNKGLFFVQNLKYIIGRVFRLDLLM